MIASIPFFDVAAVYRRSKVQIDAAVTRVLSSGHVVLGPEVEAFEAEFAAYVGTRHAIAVGSGTDALSLALRAVGVSRGDEVITVANAGVPPAAAICAAGGTPRFVDVDPQTLLMDVGAAQAAVTAHTRALLPVHLYGQCLPIAALRTLADRYGLALIEDCAHAHGLRVDGRHAGSFGTIGCYSYYPTKNLGAFGDGGACVTDDDDLAARLRRLRVYGADADGRVGTTGINSRLDEVQAAILRVLLPNLDARVARRRELARLYDELLEGAQPRHLLRDHAIDAFHLYVVRDAERSRTVRSLTDAGIGCKSHYEIPLQRMPAFADCVVPGASLANTIAGCSQVLSLPLFPDLQEADVHRVAAALARR